MSLQRVKEEEDMAASAPKTGWRWRRTTTPSSSMCPACTGVDVTCPKLWVIRFMGSPVPRRKTHRVPGTTGVGPTGRVNRCGGGGGSTRTPTPCSHTDVMTGVGMSHRVSPCALLLMDLFQHLSCQLLLLLLQPVCLCS